MISHSQIRGIIALSLLLAVIPFFRFYCSPLIDDQSPVLSKSGENTVTVELLSDHRLSGIYFVEQGATLQDLLRQINAKVEGKDHVPLHNAMTIRFSGNGHSGDVIAGNMTPAKRLALGLPIDVNRATCEDLMMIPGIGETLAQKIVSRRTDIGRFVKLEELLEIAGIKEKKLSQISPYLCIEN